MRNYDENPIIINDYGALFLVGWHIILFAFGVFIIVFGDATLLFRICMIAQSAFCCLHCIILTSSRREFSNKNQAVLDFRAVYLRR